MWSSVKCSARSCAFLADMPSKSAAEAPQKSCGHASHFFSSHFFWIYFYHCAYFSFLFFHFHVLGSHSPPQPATFRTMSQLTVHHHHLVACSSPPSPSGPWIWGAWPQFLSIPASNLRPHFRSEVIVAHTKGRVGFSGSCDVESGGGNSDRASWCDDASECRGGWRQQRAVVLKMLSFFLRLNEFLIL